MKTSIFFGIVASALASFVSMCEAGPIGFQTYDNFTLNSDGLVTSVDWQGLYGSDSNPRSMPTNASTNAWDFSFYANGSGDLPGNQIYDSQNLASNVTATNVGTVGFFNGTTSSVYNVYDFHAVLATPVSLAGGTTYWFSVLALQQVTDPGFAWMSGNGGLGNESIQVYTSTGELFHRAYDRAFTLGGASGVLYDQQADYPTFPRNGYTAWTSTVISAASVPEPTSLTLAASGAFLVAVGLSARRRSS